MCSHTINKYNLITLQGLNTLLIFAKRGLNSVKLQMILKPYLIRNFTDWHSIALVLRKVINNGKNNVGE